MLLTVVALLLGFRLLPETRHPGGATAGRKRFDVGAIRGALRQPVIGPVILTFFLATLGFGAFESTLAMMNRDLIEAKPERNFLIFAYVGFVLMLTQGVFYRRMAKRVRSGVATAVPERLRRKVREAEQKDTAYRPHELRRVQHHYEHFREKWGWDLMNPHMDALLERYGDTEVCWAYDPARRGAGEEIAAAWTASLTLDAG